MARLDQLIGAMVKHSAEALVLKEGQKPSLMMGGTPRAIVKNPLDAQQLRQLVAEVAPAGQRDAVLTGAQVAFTYNSPEGAVDVCIDSSTSTTIQQHQAAVAAVAEVAAPVDVPAAAVSPVEETAPATAPPVRPAATDGPLDMGTLLHVLVEAKGSDLHISAGCKPMLRVDGHLTLLEEYPTLDPPAAEKLLLAIAPERNHSEFVERNDTDFAYEIADLARFRCNLFRDRKGVGGVFRVIPTKILTADELGLSPQIQSLSRLTKGLVLVTGPTGSGKSTTLAAVVDLVNATRPDHVITIEDPIEFVHPNRLCLINQREVHLHTTGFKAALRAALREDPDVVLVGELRDLETVAIALETAETGHLVFGTLHTNSAVSTVDRIIDQFPGDEQARIRIMLSESLQAVIAQVLCRKIGGGRLAAQEVMIANAAVSNLIREGKTFQIPSIMQTGRKLGMITMNDALVELVRDKKIEPAEAYAKAVDKQGILASFRSKKIPADFLSVDKPEPQPA